MFLDLLIVITNDRIYKTLGQDERIIFCDEINDYDDNSDYHKIFRQVETMVSFKQRLRYNINLETMYVEMFIEVSK